MEKVKKVLQSFAGVFGRLNKLSLPAVILLGCIIIGGFYYASEVNKQKSIENQQQIKINQDKQAESMRQLDLSFCLDKADTEYWAYMKLNGTTAKDGTITAPTTDWDRAEKVKQNAIDNCYKQYK